MRLPNDTQQIVIIGRNGTGKSQAAVWHLALRNWKEKPWIILDWKREPLIARLPAKELQLGEMPEEPGLYVVHPFPDSNEEVDNLLWNVYLRENIGLYVDEGLMLNKSKAYRAICTQGRSKHIPLITLSQRPRQMDMFVFSEAAYYQVFALNDVNDRKRIAEWISPEDDNGRVFDPKKRLPQFHSWYYDVNANELSILAPVPDEDTIIEMFYPAQNDIVEEPQKSSVRFI